MVCRDDESPGCVPEGLSVVAVSEPDFKIELRVTQRPAGTETMSTAAAIRIHFVFDPVSILLILINNMDRCKHFYSSVVSSTYCNKIGKKRKGIAGLTEPKRAFRPCA